jgi:hypothetical protein
VYRELARLNPIVLELWKRVLLPRDEFVDVLLFELLPKVFFLLRKMSEVEVLTA